MEVTVLGMSQDFSFESGETTNFALLQLHTGVVIRAEVSQEAAVALTEAFLGNSAPADAMARSAREPLPPVPPVFPSNPATEVDYSPGSVTEEGDVVYGGDSVPILSPPLSNFKFEAMQQHLDAARDQVAQVAKNSDGQSAEQIHEAVQAIKKEGNGLPVPHWNNSRRPPQVTADEYGYPRIQGQGYADQGEIVGGDGDNEEDGVGSI